LAQDQLHLKGKVNGIYVINHRKAVITDGEGFDKRKSRDTLLLSAVQYKSSAKILKSTFFVLMEPTMNQLEVVIRRYNINAVSGIIPADQRTYTVAERKCN
jgi:hypothetical protein